MNSMPSMPTGLDGSGRRSSTVIGRVCYVMMIRGTTALVAHIGCPTHTFKAPMIYNPYFEQAGVDAVVVPMGCKAEHYPAFLRVGLHAQNIRGALITMPHKVSDRALARPRDADGEDRGRVQCGSPPCDGRLAGDMFDGEGLRSRSAPQRLRRRRRARAGRRRRRRRLGDRRVARRGRRGVDRPLRCAGRRGRSACACGSVALPGAPREEPVATIRRASTSSSMRRRSG